MVVYETINATPCHLVCLQETKLSVIDQPLAAFLGAYNLNCFAYKPAIGTRGGILLLWNDLEVDVSNVTIGRFSISANITLRSCLSSFLLTGLYGPSRRAEKISFLNHLRSLTPDSAVK
jgi:hypothetical protein